MGNCETMEYVIVDTRSIWLPHVRALGDRYRDTLGFMPDQVFEEYAQKRHILALVVKETLVGYVMYRYKKATIIIVHVCVAEEYRHNKYAEQLINELFRLEKEDAESFKLYCRRDYGLDGFWRSLGFIPVGEKKGRAKIKNTVLTIWARQNPEITNLFSLGESVGENRARVLVDTNIVIDL